MSRKQKYTLSIDEHILAIRQLEAINERLPTTYYGDEDLLDVVANQKSLLARRLLDERMDRAAGDRGEGRS